MFRHLFTLLTIVSLLMCVATGVVWVRSLLWADEISTGTPDGSRAVRSEAGSVIYDRYLVFGDDPPEAEVRWESRPVAPATAWPARLWSCENYAASQQVCLLGGGWRTQEPSAEAPASYSPLIVAVPYWLIFAAFLLLPIWFALRTMRQRRNSDRHLRERCLACGYDLRASLERCPECGTASTPVAPSL